MAPEPTGLYSFGGRSFVLGTEVSCVYRQGGRGRRVHVLLFAPDFTAVDKLCRALAIRGSNLESDGRPTLGLSARDLTDLAMDIDPRCLVIPAHVWTPWFGLYGSKSGVRQPGRVFPGHDPLYPRCGNRAFQRPGDELEHGRVVRQVHRVLFRCSLSGENRERANRLRGRSQLFRSCRGVGAAKGCLLRGVLPRGRQVPLQRATANVVCLCHPKRRPVTGTVARFAIVPLLWGCCTGSRSCPKGRAQSAEDRTALSTGNSAVHSSSDWCRWWT